ncbi:FHA domain-containing protein [Phocaeicola sp.]
MDKKKKMMAQKLLTVMILIVSAWSLCAQNVSKIQFCDKKYEYEVGKDSITLFFNVLDANGNRSKDVTMDALENYLVIREEGNIIPVNQHSFSTVSSGQRISAEYTFSVLVDLSIPENGKEQIFEAVGRLVDSAPDSCVYLSFFGDDVSPTQVVSRQNYKDIKSQFLTHSDNKFFYSALYSKLVEFSEEVAALESAVRMKPGYAKNTDISHRAQLNRDKNILFVFTEGSKRPDDEDITFVEVTEYQTSASHIVPKVFALYYTEDGETPAIETTLMGICSPKDFDGRTLSDRTGQYMPSNDMNQILKNFESVVNDAMYDFAFSYKATGTKIYSGKVTYSAEWKGSEAGTGDYSIGSAETPWPLRPEDTGDMIVKYLVALLATLFTFAFFFTVMKIAIPYCRSKSFALKYYKRYVREENVQRRICHYCKQDIQEGQYVVVKCKHIMHVHCWQQNGYKCAEYGQNCKTGIQSHIDWTELFTMASLRDCYQTMAGIAAGFVSWIIYELCGRGGFDSLATGIVEMFFTNDEQHHILFEECVNKTSAFLTIGLLLGFFLSLIFRYNDEYRKTDWKVSLKIVGLSLLTGVIGMVSFAVGANIFCLLLSCMDTTYIPWYCSLPGYLLFSICVSLGLTIKSTIPVKSAIIGGLCSAVIGFIVLYFSEITSSRWGWMNMLLDFTIYGGGLGASLVTVRMLAEKYFLVMQNGVRAGQRIPIHKWMNATGGGNKVSIGMTGECEIQMNWEKSNKVAKEHAQLYIDHEKSLPALKPLATGVIFNTRAELPVGKPYILSNGDTFKIGDTIFQYVETE